MNKIIKVLNNKKAVSNRAFIIDFMFNFRSEFLPLNDVFLCCFKYPLDCLESLHQVLLKPTMNDIKIIVRKLFDDGLDIYTNSQNNWFLLLCDLVKIYSKTEPSHVVDGYDYDSRTICVKVDLSNDTEVAFDVENEIEDDNVTPYLQNERRFLDFIMAAKVKFHFKRTNANKVIFDELIQDVERNIESMECCRPIDNCKSCDVQAYINHLKYAIEETGDPSNCSKFFQNILEAIDSTDQNKIVKILDQIYYEEDRIKFKF
jgi:hypothetical protein